MTTVDQAVDLIMQNTQSQQSEQCSLAKAKNRVLAEPIIADRGHPPFNRVAMDGIAINAKYKFEGKPLTEWSVQACQAAGAPAEELTHEKNCIEIMTGAKLPRGCDTIIPYERLDIKGGVARLKEGESFADRPLKSNVHVQDSDYSAGVVLVEKGKVLRSPELAIAATVGLANPKVIAQPKIAVISTGDELVSVSETPSDVQIRQSNQYAIAAQLESLSGVNGVECIHLKDDKDLIFAKIEELLNRFEWIVLSGGVSMGRFDFVPKVLSDLKVKQVFHKVTQRPGKPLWFGKGLSGQHVFGLPGNPVSATVSCRRYVVPALLRSLGRSEKPVWARLTENVEFSPSLTKFQPARFEYSQQGALQAFPVKMNGSGDLASLAKSDGFVELPAEKSLFEASESYRAFFWEASL